MTQSVAKDVAELSVAGRRMSTESNNVRTNTTKLFAIAESLRSTAARFRIADHLFDQVAVKNGHVKWRTRVSQMLNGHLQITLSEAKDHHACALGQWYDSEEGQQWNHLPAFQKMGNTHEAFHKEVAGIVSLWNSGERPKAHERYARLLTLTDEIFEMLDQISVEAAGA